MKIDAIRKMFLDYFKRNGHEVLQSSSLVPQNDPTLMFTNAGMNQFKDVFTGLEKRPYRRATTAQKCFRASGKHNDLENVGRTARHHTFFEMLGNFSFGDYFKKDAIRFAWELLTEDYGLPREKLWITIFQDDDEAFELWREVAKLPPDRVLRMGEKDNFWSMGDTGPCGPCSELHIDQGEKVGCGKKDCRVGCECDRFLELWNLVFMQFDRDATGKMTPLPRPSIDTGMGLERIAAVLQGKQTNYDSDLFLDLIHRIAKLTAVPYRQNETSDVSIRVIADHARAMAFLIADGVLPANEGRGYVLRRVMRRAGRHAKMLGQDQPVLFKVAETVVDLMAEAYPELQDRRAFIAEVVKNEEARFLETLDAGLRILDGEIEKIHAGPKQGAPGKVVSVIPGDLVFKLYDSYGFPVDLTQTIAEEHNLQVDMPGFEAAMNGQRERSREHWKGSGAEAVDRVYKDVLAEVGPTEFKGYDELFLTTTTASLMQGGTKVLEINRPGAEFQIVAAKTPFYGESGGQVGDTGAITTASGFEAECFDATRPLEGLIVHHCRLKKGAIKKGDPIELTVNPDRRADIMRNHSATHLLQAALRQIVGDHVHQKGSLVTPDRLRFDLTHFSPLTPDELQKIEDQVNRWVRENHEISISQLAHAEAVKQGAMALFGEKYGDVVRMVRIGPFSRELCGGAHAQRSGDVGAFKIVAESGVAAGVRRIEAVTGRAAVALVQDLQRRLQEAADLLKAQPDELADRIKKLQDEVKSLKRDLKAEREKKHQGGDILAQVVEVKGVRTLVVQVEVENPKDLRPIGDDIKARLKSGVAVIAAAAAGKAHLLAVVTDDLTGRLKAGDIVRDLAPIVGGKGGGRPDFAQAGGPNPDQLPAALESARRWLDEHLE